MLPWPLHEIKQGRRKNPAPLLIHYANIGTAGFEPATP